MLVDLGYRQQCLELPLLRLHEVRQLDEARPELRVVGGPKP